MEMSRQITSTILMIRPVRFRFNEQTAVNNYYQQQTGDLKPEEVIRKAQQEFDDFVQVLRQHGIEVIVIEDTTKPDTPDSIFPNNWISFHEDGRVVVYPMYAENRRLERREDILEILQRKHAFTMTEKVDFTFYEAKNKFLEGTGSIVLDRVNKIAYAALSQRTNEVALEEFCDKFDYEPVLFTAYQNVDGHRLPIYHTNVMMCIAEKFSILCAESIDDQQERNTVINKLEATGREVVFISEEQKGFFAGNMLQVANTAGEKYLIMSTAAYNSLTDLQVNNIHKYCPIIHSPLHTIEALGGGSARCMMAEIFLPKGKQGK